MGLLKIESRQSGECFLFATVDLKSLENRFRFQLKMGSHPDKSLQKLWTSQGGQNFSIEVLDRLDYDKDPAKTNYSKDLELLEMIWREKLEL